MKARYHFDSVQDRLRRCYEAAMKPNFIKRVIKEVRRRGLLLIRLHCSGDFFSQQYAERWLAIMTALPRVKFWLYSRSWRVPAIEAVLRCMAVLPNCRVWFSLDRDTGLPAERPEGVRYAYLQDNGEMIDEADLVFRTRNMLTASRVGLPMVCPTDTVQGRKSMSCGSCGVCFD